MSTLYNLHSDGDQWRITKFNDGNVESSYLCSHEECTCPAGHRHTCRHRQMLPEMLAARLENSHYFWDFDRHMAFDISGNAKHLLDALAATKPAPALAAEGNDQDVAEDILLQPYSQEVKAGDFDSPIGGSNPPAVATPAKPWRRI